MRSQLRDHGSLCSESLDLAREFSIQSFEHCAGIARVTIGPVAIEQIRHLFERDPDCRKAPDPQHTNEVVHRILAIAVGATLGFTFDNLAVIQRLREMRFQLTYRY